METLRAVASSERTLEGVAKGLDVVRTLLSNIATSPGEARYRRVRRNNPRIRQLLGREEEGLLRAAGFADEADGTLACFSGGGVGDAANQPDVPAALHEILDATGVVLQVLSARMTELGDVASTLRCLEDAALVQGLECALLDHVGQRSADLAEAEKRRRRSDEAEDVRSPGRWRDVFARVGGGFLCDGGLLETWLDSDAAHRCLAHDLVELQRASVRWYGRGAERHCERWRLQVRGHAVASDGGSGGSESLPPYGAMFAEELRVLRDALFEFPEWPGAPPALFSESHVVDGDHDERTTLPRDGETRSGAADGVDAKGGVASGADGDPSGECDLVAASPFASVRAAKHHEVVALE